MKAILFDFGGTIDTNGVHWSEKFWEYYVRFKVGVRKDVYEKAFVTSEQELGTDRSLRDATMYATLLKQFSLQFAILGLPRGQDDIMKMVNACYADTGKTIAAAKQVMQKFAPAYRMGIVSNFYGNLEVVAKEFGLESLCAVLIDSVLVGVRKPDPAIFALALDRLGVQPNLSYVVGDSYERDILPAKHLGCTTVWLEGKSWTRPASLDAADHTIFSFEELTRVIPMPS
jgi:FMN phosphatase YigB (HAD superfamily)